MSGKERQNDAIGRSAVSTDANTGDLSRSSPPAIRSIRSAFSIRGLMLLTALVAGILATNSLTTSGSKLVLITVALAVFFGGRRTRAAALCLFVIIFSPYIWLFWDWQHWPWHNYRWQWIAMWWQLPGILAAVPFHPLPEPWFDVFTTMATLALFFTLVMIARTSRIAGLITLSVAAIYSLLNAWLCWAIYSA